MSSARDPVRVFIALVVVALSVACESGEGGESVSPTPEVVSLTSSLDPSVAFGGSAESPSGPDLFIFEVATGTLRGVTIPNGEPLGFPRWADKEDALLFESTAATYRLDMDGSISVAQTPTPISQIQEPFISFDGA